MDQLWLTEFNTQSDYILLKVVNRNALLIKNCCQNSTRNGSETIQLRTFLAVTRHPIFLETVVSKINEHLQTAAMI